MATINTKVETPATPAVETPATPAVETPATPALQDDELEKAKKLMADAELKKAEQATKIAELNADISKAEAEKSKYAGIMSGTSDMDKMIQELISKQAGRLDEINNAPDVARKALADYKLSILSPAEREARTKWSEAEQKVKDAQTALEALKTEIMAKYPDFFGTVKAPKAAKTGTTEKTASAGTGVKVPFTGVMNTKEVDEVKIKELIKSGVTGESDILRAIYPGDYTMSGSVPRMSRHALILKLRTEAGVA